MNPFSTHRRLLMRRTASEVLRSLEMRVARLEANLNKRAAWPTIEDSLFSIEGGKPATGNQIMKEYRNQYKGVALEMGLEKAFFEGEHKGDRDIPKIKLVKKQ